MKRLLLPLLAVALLDAGAQDATEPTHDKGFAEGMSLVALPGGGALVAWGRDENGQCDVPDGTNYVSVAAGSDFSVGLKNDGSLEFWGGWEPANWRTFDNSGFVQIDARDSSWIGRRADGSIEFRDGWRDCDIPQAATNPVQVAVGGSYTVWHGSGRWGSRHTPFFCLSEDGTVVVWTTNPDVVPRVPDRMNGAVAIAAGECHLLSLKSDGSVATWSFGNDYDGDGEGDNDLDGMCNVPFGLSNVKALAAGASFSMALLENGRVVVWGDQDDDCGVRHVPAAATNVIEIAAGNSFCMAKTEDGRILCWGGYQWDDYGEADVPAITSRVLGIGAGAYHGLAVVEAAPPAFPDEPVDVSCHVGQPVVLEAEVFSAPVAALQWFKDGVPLEGETSERLAIETAVAADSGTYRLVASNAVGVVSSHEVDVLVDPTPAVGRIHKLTGPAFPGNRLVLRAKPYGDLSEATFAWTRDGTTVATTERFDIAALSDRDFGTYALTVTTPYGTATSEPFVLLPAPAGVPVGWGADGHGRTTAPEGLTGVAQIASGMNFNLGLSTNGTVTAWGYNGHGGCNVPDGLFGVSFVAAGGYESQGAGFAVKTDGSVTAWGRPMALRNTYVFTNGLGWTTWTYDGEYDKHENEYKLSRIEIETNGWDTVSTMPADLADVVKIAVCGGCAVALQADGSVTSWGATRISESWQDWYDENGEYWGEVRVVTTNAIYETPTGLSDVVDVAAGSSFLMALKADGTVVVWNDGGYYSEDPFAPNENFGECDVPDGLSDVVAITAGKQNWEGRACFALKTDGTIMKWGDRYDYFGLSRTTAAGAVDIDAGQEHLVALDADGNVRVWAGWDSYGVKRIPASVTNALAAAAGGYHCTAILPDTDGDTIPDAEELAYGRDPFVWEDWRRSTVSGTVSTEFGSVESARLLLFDASGTPRATVRTDETGAFRFERVLPATYTLKVEAADAVDAWFDGVAAGSGGEPTPIAVPGASALELTIRLEPGQGVAGANPTGLGEDAETGETVEVPLPDGTVVYLDMWPVEADADGGVDLGEVAASHAGAAPHQVTVKPPAANAPVPSPVPVAGVEGERVRVPVHVAGPTGSLRIETAPAGAEVFVDYADAPLGVTPLSVGNLLAGSHTILLRKDGYLRPRPVVALVESDAVSEVDIPLQTAADTNEMTVAVSCCLPDQEIYLDYLPTGDVAPATVGGMDPASHAGDGWFSASHVILLKHPMVRPWAPRVVPEPVRDEETGLWCFDAVLEIEGPQLYDDADGDGVRNDVEITDGGSPFETAATQTTAVPVPFDWLGRFGLGDGTASGYEAAAAAPAANGRNSVWECYVVGLDPTNENSLLRTTIRMDGDTPVIDVDPPRPGHTPESWYRVEGKRELSDEWAPKADGHRFFQVHVVIPGE